MRHDLAPRQHAVFSALRQHRPYALDAARLAGFLRRDPADVRCALRILSDLGMIAHEEDGRYWALPATIVRSTAGGYVLWEST